MQKSKEYRTQLSGKDPRAECFVFIDVLSALRYEVPEKGLVLSNTNSAKRVNISSGSLLAPKTHFFSFQYEEKETKATVVILMGTATRKRNMPHLTFKHGTRQTETVGNYQEAILTKLSDFHYTAV